MSRWPTRLAVFEGALVYSANAGAPPAPAAVEGRSDVGSHQSFAIMDHDVGADGLLVVELSCGKCALSLGPESAVSTVQVDRAGDGLLTLTGTLSDVNAALRAVNYAGLHDETGGDTVVVSVNDTGNSGHSGVHLTASKHMDVWIEAVNDAPTVSAPAEFMPPPAESEVPAESPLFGIVVADVDASPDSLFRVSVEANRGRVSLNSLAGLTFETGTGESDSFVQVLGTVGDINKALYRLRYRCWVTDGCDLTAGDDLVRVVADDNGNNGLGGPLTGEAEILVRL